ncbi:hypothetical protein E2P47_01340 [Candidatus Bathyarchaeota archaeon]|nr:hypothetical protein E2P47_01340 [Candidatus Bathyarchaeota archaeon]
MNINQDMKKNQISIPLHSPSWKEKMFFFISGAIIGIPVNVYFHSTIIDALIGIPPFYELLISELILAPFIGEFAKLFGLLYRHGETEKSLFNLAILAGLGFGIVEFIILTIDRCMSLFLCFPRIFFHPFAVAITVYGLVKHQTLKYYLVAVLLHFLYNLSIFFIVPESLFATSAAFIISILIVLITYFFAKKLESKTKNKIYTLN